MPDQYFPLNSYYAQPRSTQNRFAKILKNLKEQVTVRGEKHNTESNRQNGKEGNGGGHTAIISVISNLNATIPQSRN